MNPIFNSNLFNSSNSEESSVNQASDSQKIGGGKVVINVEKMLDSVVKDTPGMAASINLATAMVSNPGPSQTQVASMIDSVKELPTDPPKRAVSEQEIKQRKGKRIKGMQQKKEKKIEKVKLLTRRRTSKRSQQQITKPTLMATYDPGIVRKGVVNVKNQTILKKSSSEKKLHSEDSEYIVLLDKVTLYKETKYTTGVNLIKKQTKILNKINNESLKTLKKIDELEYKNVVGKIGSVKNLFQISLIIEKSITLNIMEVLKKIDGSKSFSKQLNIIDSVKDKINILKTMNINMSSIPIEFYFNQMSEPVKLIINCIKPIYNEKISQKSMKKEQEFLTKTKTFIAISIIKMDFYTQTKKFNAALSKSLINKNHKIDLIRFKKICFSSLLANYKNEESLLIVNKKGKSKKINLKATSKLINKNDLNFFKPNKGSSSEFAAPIWPDDLKKDPDLENVLLLKSTKKAMGDIMSGSFALTEKGLIFYTPAYLDVAHELIHIFNNSQGKNALLVEIRNKKALATWTDCEEFMTIEGGTFSENIFAAELGLPKRATHLGVSFTEFFQKKWLENNLDTIFERRLHSKYEKL